MPKISDHTIENSIIGSWMAWIVGVAAEVLPLLQALSFIAAFVLSVLGIITWIKKNVKKKND